LETFNGHLTNYIELIKQDPQQLSAVLFFTKTQLGTIEKITSLATPDIEIQEVLDLTEVNKQGKDFPSPNITEPQSTPQLGSQFFTDQTVTELTEKVSVHETYNPGTGLFSFCMKDTLTGNHPSQEEAIQIDPQTDSPISLDPETSTDKLEPNFQIPTIKIKPLTHRQKQSKKFKDLAVQEHISTGSTEPFSWKIYNKNKRLAKQLAKKITEQQNQNQKERLAKDCQGINIPILKLEKKPYKIPHLATDDIRRQKTNIVSLLDSNLNRPIVTKPEPKVFTKKQKWWRSPESQDRYIAKQNKERQHKRQQYQQWY
jgi:hypothetical protein